MGGWGIIAADVIVMANLAQIAGSYSFTLVGAPPNCREHLLVDGGRHHLDHPDDLHLLSGYRSLGAHPVRATRNRADGAGRLRRRGAVQGLHRSGQPRATPSSRRSTGSGPPVGLLHRDRTGSADHPVHLGLGQAVACNEERTTGHHAGPGGGDLHLPAAGHVRHGFPLPPSPLPGRHRRASSLGNADNADDVFAAVGHDCLGRAPSARSG